MAERAGRAERRNAARGENEDDDDDEDDDPDEEEQEAPEEAQGEEDHNDDRSEGHRDRPLARAPGPRNCFPLPKFEGRAVDSRRVEQLLDMLRAYDDFHGLTSNVHKVGKLYGVFDIGTIAGQWFSAMRRAGRLKTYAEFETEFRSHFSMTKSDKFVLHKQLRTFVQRDTDGVQTYYTNLQRIFTDLWAVGCEYSQEMKVNHLVCGLKKTIVIVCRPI